MGSNPNPSTLQLCDSGPVSSPAFQFRHLSKAANNTPHEDCWGLSVKALTPHRGRQHMRTGPPFLLAVFAGVAVVCLMGQGAAEADR